MTERQDARRRGDDEGAIGIGTMIVFIAMVIVAAVAAAVLINTAGSLQRQSAETGQETTQEVSGNIFVRDIVGNISQTSGEIQNVSWYVSLAPGAEPIDLQLMNIRWEHGSNLTDFRHVDQDDVAATECDTVDDWSSDTSAFCVEPILDVGDTNPNVLSGGDRAKIYVTLEDGGSWSAQVGTRESVDALLMPEKGTPVDAGFTTPATFGQRSNLSLK